MPRAKATSRTQGSTPASPPDKTPPSRLSYREAEACAAKLRSSWADSLLPPPPTATTPPPPTPQPRTPSHTLRTNLPTSMWALLSVATLGSILFVVVVGATHLPLTRPHKGVTRQAPALADEQIQSPARTGEVQVHITARPPGSELWVNGRPVHTPLRTSVAPNGRLRLDLRPPLHAGSLPSPYASTQSAGLTVTLELAQEEATTPGQLPQIDQNPEGE